MVRIFVLYSIQKLTLVNVFFVEDVKVVSGVIFLSGCATLLCFESVIIGICPVQESSVAVAKATELFINLLVNKAYKTCISHNRKTLKFEGGNWANFCLCTHLMLLNQIMTDILEVIDSAENVDQFQFLYDAFGVSEPRR